MIYIILLTFYFLDNIIKADDKEESLVVNLDKILELVVRLSLLSLLLVNILQDDNIIYIKIDDLLNKTTPDSGNSGQGGNGGNNPNKGSIKYILNSDDNQYDNDKDQFMKKLYEKNTREN